MNNDGSPRPRKPALDRIDCVLVFSDGESNFARITRGGFLQWGGTLAQIQATAPILDALSHAFAASEGASDD